MGARTSHRTVLVGLMATVLIGCTDPELADQVARLEAENQALAERVDGLEASVAGLNLAQLQEPLSVRLTDLERTVSQLEDALVGMDGRSDDLEALYAVLFDDIDSVAACVNDYMDTIASWSSRISTSFTYYYC